MKPFHSIKVVDLADIKEIYLDGIKLNSVIEVIATAHAENQRIATVQITMQTDDFRWIKDGDSMG